MSSLAISTSASATLPTANIHPGHGHRKGGMETDPLNSDSDSSTAAQIPVAGAQNLFGSLLNSLEGVLGIQPPSFVGSSTTLTNASPAAAGAAAAGATAASKINVMA